MKVAIIGGNLLGCATAAHARRRLDESAAAAAAAEAASAAVRAAAAAPPPASVSSPVPAVTFTLFERAPALGGAHFRTTPAAGVTVETGRTTDLATQAPHLRALLSLAGLDDQPLWRRLAARAVAAWRRLAAGGGVAGAGGAAAVPPSAAAAPTPPVRRVPLWTEGVDAVTGRSASYGGGRRGAPSAGGRGGRLRTFGVWDWATDAYVVSHGGARLLAAARPVLGSALPRLAATAAVGMAAQRVRDAPTATLRAAWGAVTAAAAWTSAVGLLPAVDAVERSVMTVAANVGGMVRHGMVAPLSRGALRGFCVQLTTGAADATASTVRRTRLPDLLAFHALDRYTAMTAGEMWAKFGLSAPFMDAVHLPFARAAYARGVADAAAAAAAGSGGAGGGVVRVTDTVDGAEPVETTTAVAGGVTGAEASAAGPGRGGEAAADGGLTALQALLALQVADVTDAESVGAVIRVAPANAAVCDLLVGLVGVAGGGNAATAASPVDVRLSTTVTGVTSMEDGAATRLVVRYVDALVADGDAVEEEFDAVVVCCRLPPGTERGEGGTAAAATADAAEVGHKAEGVAEGGEDGPPAVCAADSLNGYLATSTHLSDDDDAIRPAPASTSPSTTVVPAFPTTLAPATPWSLALPVEPAPPRPGGDWLAVVVGNLNPGFFRYTREADVPDLLHAVHCTSFSRVERYGVAVPAVRDAAARGAGQPNGGPYGTANGSVDDGGDTPPSVTDGMYVYAVTTGDAFVEAGTRSAMFARVAAMPHYAPRPAPVDAAAVLAAAGAAGDDAWAATAAADRRQQGTRVRRGD
ncbi:hypothetical protein I4F81_007535 [Pyropia yezoensis]|uniref:Uncharacterized protein n=1 Tax=Pyropia yezoensis TaxID=2788 RepID=A0ACC3C4X7_PYRYE|nr:hypothetical protein I4F81_007535 [Neopyropia yezoensis]